MSTHTNQSEDNIHLMQSSGSIEGHGEGEEEGEGHTQGTVKFLNFPTPENIGVIFLKTNLREFHQKGANGIANSEDPDHTVPLGAV